MDNNLIAKILCVACQFILLRKTNDEGWSVTIVILLLLLINILII